MMSAVEEICLVHNVLNQSGSPVPHSPAPVCCGTKLDPGAQHVQFTLHHITPPLPTRWAVPELQSHSSFGSAMLLQWIRKSDYDLSSANDETVETNLNLPSYIFYELVSFLLTTSFFGGGCGTS